MLRGGGPVRSGPVGLSRVLRLVLNVELFSSYVRGCVVLYYYMTSDMTFVRFEVLRLN